jgi:hypothetical protein
MARVGGASGTNLNALYKMMAELGHAIDDKSHGKSTVSVTEAEKIIQHMDGLDPKVKTQMHGLMAEALAADLFTVSDRARVRFSTALNIPVEKLTPQEIGKMAGLQSARSSFNASLKSLSKTPQVDRKQMDLLLSRSKELMPRPLQQFMAAALTQANKEDIIKMDTKARKAFTKDTAKLDNDGGVTTWKKVFEQAGDPAADYLARLLMSGMCFEDMVAAFMVHITGKLQQELKGKMAEMEEMRKTQAKERDERRQTRGMDPMAQRFLGQNMENVRVIDDTPGAKGKDNPATTVDNPVADKKQPSVADTRAHLEAVVQSAHKHLNDDGVIDQVEAGKIAEKLDRLEGPVADLIAGSLANALRRSGLDLEGELKPLTDWCRNKLGPDTDMSPMPKNSSGDPNNPWVVSLKDSDKLENKIASFLVDVLTSSDKNIQDTMSELKTFREDITQYPASEAAAEALLEKEAKQEAKVQAQASTSAAESAQVQNPAPANGAQAQVETLAPTLSAGRMTPQQLKRAMDAGGPQVAQTAKGAKKAGAVDTTAKSEGPEKGHAEKAEDAAISRDKLMQDIKNLMQLISQVTQALSNMLNVMHQTARNSIQNIR